MELLNQIFQLCLVPLLGVLTVFLVQLIKTKRDDLLAETDNELTEKYLIMLADTIEICVIATNQTYVNALKDKDAFTKEAQMEAFRMTYSAVMDILSEEAKKYLRSAVGDLEKYIVEQIEASVNSNKYNHE